MPSTKDPNLVVQPGPGQLPAGVVPASALLFVPGGGGGAALNAHINNPLNAHFAHAIGVDPYYPPLVGPTATPILTSVGGVVDGESVLDFINQFKDLIPPSPNSIGFSVAPGGTGVPSWSTLNANGVAGGTAFTGGYASAAGTGQPVTFSHFLVPTSVSTFAPTGLVFPADKGVLAFYSTTGGDFFNAGQTTLVAALSLNDTAPAGIPDAAFNESLRTGQQANHASTSGLNLFSLTFRLPYLTSYAPYPGTPFGPFTYNFYSFQLAEYALTAQAVATGNSQSFLLVHWKETYATTLTAIQVANLTLATLTSTNCYSAVPVSGNFDDNTQPVYNVNRHNVFKDTSSGASPAGSVFTSTPNGTPSTIFLSGVKYYSVASGAGALQWTVDIRATGLFANSFQTGSTSSPPNVPAQFASAFDPIQMPFTNFGGGTLDVPYYNMNKFGGGAYTNANTPQPADTGEYTNSALAIVSPAAHCPVGGFAQLIANLRTPFQETVYTDPNKYLFDSYNQTGSGISTTTFDPFVDEHYRYVASPDPTTVATLPIVPTGGNIFPSGTALASGGVDLQVAGQEIIYPVTNYNVATFLPAQTAAQNYSTIAGSDGADHLRRYLRAFDTGTARNTGNIIITGVAASNFAVSSPTFDGGETTGHLSAAPNGGMIIQIKVPGTGAGSTGWLDLGRAFGSPGSGVSDFFGCATLTVTSGSTVTVSYNSTVFTGNNGSGQFPLFVRVTLINGVGNSYAPTSIAWAP
jgi:hypothetical protein